MRYNVYCQLTGQEAQWAWEYPTIQEAEAAVVDLLGERGYDHAWIEPASAADALEVLEAEVASLKAKVKTRNRQIRDLRRQLRK